MTLKTGDKVKVKLPGGEIEGEVTVQIIPGSDGKDKLGVECKDAEGNPFYVEVPASWCTLVHRVELDLPDNIMWVPKFKCQPEVTTIGLGYPRKTKHEALAAFKTEIGKFRAEGVFKMKVLDFEPVEFKDLPPTFEMSPVEQEALDSTKLRKVERPEGLGK